MEYLIKALSRYGFFGILRLARDVVLTKISIPHARLIRRPVYIRGKKYIEIGENFTSGVGLRMDAFGHTDKQIRIGSNVQIGDYNHIAAIQSIIIEDDVLMASKVFISDHNHGSYHGNDISKPDTKPYQRPLHANSVLIQSNVWIGEGVQILPGVTIGKGSIIGAGAVVTKSIPENSIAAGNPAKVMKKYSIETGSWEDNHSSSSKNKR